MNKAIKMDLADATLAIEHIVDNLHNMQMKDKVDCCARLRGVAKSIETLDKSVKDDIKKELNEEEGSVYGGVFKATLKLIEVTRLNVSALKTERPDVYDDFCEEKYEARITFEPR